MLQKDVLPNFFFRRFCGPTASTLEQNYLLRIWNKIFFPSHTYWVMNRICFSWTEIRRSGGAWSWWVMAGPMGGGSFFCVNLPSFLFTVLISPAFRLSQSLTSFSLNLCLSYFTLNLNLSLSSMSLNFNHSLSSFSLNLNLSLSSSSLKLNLSFSSFSLNLNLSLYSFCFDLSSFFFL